MGLFRPDAEKIERWKYAGKISKLASATSDEEFGNKALDAITEIVTEPDKFINLEEETVLEALDALISLNPTFAARAVVAYSRLPTSKAALACKYVDHLAAKPNEATFAGILFLTPSRLGNVGQYALQIARKLDFRGIEETFRAALLEADHDTLEVILEFFEKRQVVGSHPELIRRFSRARPNLRRRIARALRRQGFGSAQMNEIELKAYLLVEEKRFTEAAAIGQPAWYALADALGQDPDPSPSTMEMVAALAQIDFEHLRDFLRKMLHAAARKAMDKPSNETYEQVKRTAQWILPAWATVLGDFPKASQFAGLIRSDHYKTLVGLLEETNVSGMFGE